MNDINKLRQLILRQKKKAYNNSKRGDDYIWYFNLEDDGTLNLIRGYCMRKKGEVVGDMWTPIPITHELYNYLENY